jgi:hypothetical protein
LAHSGALLIPVLSLTPVLSFIIMHASILAGLAQIYIGGVASSGQDVFDRRGEAAPADK